MCKSNIKYFIFRNKRQNKGGKEESKRKKGEAGEEGEKEWRKCRQKPTGAKIVEVIYSQGKV